MTIFKKGSLVEYAKLTDLAPNSVSGSFKRKKDRFKILTVK